MPGSTGAKPITAAVVVIGNEVLSGRTQDANVHYLGRRLAERGVRLREVRIVTDDEDAIAAAVNELRARHDHVFTTGGIGPTHDDITARSVAKAFGAGFGRNAEAEAILRRHYKPEDLTEARLKMADMPDPPGGVTLLENPVSRAPGFRIGNVYVLPGVPKIMQAMFDQLAATLAGGPPVESVTVTAALPEGTMAAPLADVQARHPGVEIGSYPFFRMGRIGSALVARSADAAGLEAAAADIRAMVRDLGGEILDD